jgi:arsenical pump membrane protein
MHLPALHSALIWTIAFAGIALMLYRPWHIREAAWIGAAAVVLVASRLIPVHIALAAVGKGANVYLFLTGMMLLSELARHEGVFDWVADRAVSRSRGSASRMFLLVYVTGVAVTALLSNDATAVVLTPAVLAAVRRARVDPKPYLLACAFVANAASFMLPISNPANLVVFGNHLPPLGMWLRVLLLPSVVAIAATYGCLYATSRKPLQAQVQCPQNLAPLSPAGRLAFGGLIVSAVTLLIVSALGVSLGIPTCAVALAAMIAVSFRDRGIYKAALREVSWSVLPLVAGLFVLVESLNRAGLLRLLEASLRWLAHQPTIAAYLAASSGAALLANIMNNLPVALGAGSALRLTPQLSHAVLIGVDLGPNLSVTASLATILWLMALRRENIKLTRGQFFKTGLIIMPATLLLSVLALWLVN